MQFDKQPAKRTAVAPIDPASFGPVAIGSTHPDRSNRHRRAVSGGGSRRRGEGRLYVLDAGAAHPPLGHGVAGAPAIHMPNGFRHLTGAAMLYGPEPAAAGAWFDPETWWSSIGAALCWLSSQIVEGLAMSAAVTHSEFIWPLGEHLDDGSESSGRSHVPHRLPGKHEVVTYRPLRGVRQIQPAVGGTVGIGAPQPVGAAADVASGSELSWSQWTTSFLSGLRSKALHRRRVKRMRTDWQAIDDRTLKDIGLSRYDVGLIVGDLRRWD
jgi:uncharacterized protein YjiS (DUF1127 family)